MRLRNKPWAKPLIDANPQYVVTEPEKFAGKWQERFEKEQPIFVEVGTGKGRFIVEMAEKYPDKNFIGLEMQTVAVGIALKKQLDAKLACYEFWVDSKTGSILKICRTAQF